MAITEIYGQQAQCHTQDPPNPPTIPCSPPPAFLRVEEQFAEIILFCVDQFRVFLRALYRSFIFARTDVLIFSSLSASKLRPVVQEETESFSRLVRLYGELNSMSEESEVMSLDVTQFLKFGKEEKTEERSIPERRSCLGCLQGI
ncbi:hypothetical protein PVL29_020941 [Vitis rotundifolia]|uniref:DUF7780 domain-containing protein n=1 Tax=Vitis rotundifolia TaxID=103349 RepID=A0AA39DBH7_VITRO|nr:hypothetical protein PVL29_020941 [Vitis rotundifolia]